MKKQMPDCTILIPNYNGSALLKKKLPCILRAIPKNIPVILVDDNSTDTSVQIVTTRYPRVKIIRKHSHGGFSSAVEEGMRHINGGIAVLLNTDIVPNPGFLQPLLDHFGNPRVFAVGCRELTMVNGKHTQHGRGLGHWTLGMYANGFSAGSRKNTAWVSGGSGAFRVDIWKKLGGLDMIFSPFYWEDLDICYRARKAGYTLLFEPKSIVRHYHGEGAIQTHYTHEYIQSVLVRNRYLFVWKNCTDRVILFVHLLTIPARIFRACIRMDTAHLKGFREALSLLPSVRKRREVLRRLWTVPDRNLDIR